MARGWPCQVLFILVTELCERFAFYGFSGSLVFFFIQLGMSNVLATELNSLFGSIVYLTPVLGAYMADVHWGRYATIKYFCFLYLVGLALTTAGAWPTDGAYSIHPQLALVLSLCGLFIGVTVGAGGIKSNVVVLGADQFVLPEQATEQAAFFNFFYWAINIGATAAYLFLTNLALHGLGDLIPQRFGFFASFAIPTAAFLIAVLAFLVGRQYYTVRPPEGSAVVSFVRTLRIAVWRGRGRMLLAACPIMCLAFGGVLASFFVPSGLLHDGLSMGGLGLIFLSLLLLIGCGNSTSWLQLPDGASQPEAVAAADAADVVRILPLSACVVIFWVIYAQMTSNFQLQGCQMDLNTLGMKLSPATLNVFDSVVIMLLIPLVDRGLYPLLAYLRMPLSMLTKIAIGFGFALGSVLMAAFVERMRKEAPLVPGDAGISSCPNGVRMSTLSIWWQTPQYALVGLGEIFAAITCYELFYAEVPPHMRSVCQSINLLCVAFGSLAAAGLSSVCAAWLPDNLNDGHLDLLFFTLAGMMALNILLFIYLASSFRLRSGVTQLDGGTADGESVRDPRLSAGLPIEHLEPGVRLSRSSRLTGRSTRTDGRSTAQSEHLDALLLVRDPSPFGSFSRGRPSTNASG